MGAAIVCILFPSYYPADAPRGDQLVLTIRNSDTGVHLTLPDGTAVGTRAWYNEYRKRDGAPFDGYVKVCTFDYLYYIFYQDYFKKHKRMPTRAQYYAMPPLSTDALKGDIVPLLGFMYRAKGASFYWVSPKDLPDGLTPPERDSLFVPLQRFDVGGLWFGDEQSSLHCPIINTGKGGKEPKDGPTATLTYVGNEAAVRKGKFTGTVRAGDIVVLPNEGGYVVRRIIPAGPRGGAIGWVELSSLALSEDEVKKSGKSVVRLEPVK